MNDIWMGSEWSLTFKTRTYVTYLVMIREKHKTITEKKIKIDKQNWQWQNNLGAYTEDSFYHRNLFLHIW
jgi:hypothetical protein